MPKATGVNDATTFRASKQHKVNSPVDTRKHLPIRKCFLSTKGWSQ